MITNVQKKVKQFLQEALEVQNTGEAVRVTGIVKTDEGWVAQAEAIERSRLLPGYRVFEKKYYLVKLNSELEIYAYQQVEKKEDQQESSEST